MPSRGIMTHELCLLKKSPLFGRKVSCRTWWVEVIADFVTRLSDSCSRQPSELGATRLPKQAQYRKNRAHGPCAGAPTPVELVAFEHRGAEESRLTEGEAGSAGMGVGIAAPDAYRASSRRRPHRAPVAVLSESTNFGLPGASLSLRLPPPNTGCVRPRPALHPRIRYFRAPRVPEKPYSLQLSFWFRILSATRFSGRPLLATRG